MKKLFIILNLFLSLSMGQIASMPDTVAYMGGSISIPVTITNVVELEGLALTIQYDESVLTAMSSSFENTELDGMNYGHVYNPILGEFMFSAYAGGSSLFSGSGNLLFINFDVIGGLLESSDLTFTSIEINNISILESVQNGSVTIVTIDNGGCTDPEACNYDESASQDDGSCEYEIDCYGDCGGNLVEDECGVCGGDGTTCSELLGCTYEQSWNYDSDATIDDGSCEFGDANQPPACIWDCEGFSDLTYGGSTPLPSSFCVWLLDVWDTGCGLDCTLGGGMLEFYDVCDYCIPQENCDYMITEYGFQGCKYPGALNYNPLATIDDGSCEFILGDFNQDGILDILDIVQIVNTILDAF